MSSSKPQRTETIEKLYSGRLRIERRNDSPNFYSRTFLNGRWVVKTTGETTLHAARIVAEKWYVEQLVRARSGERIHRKVPFADAVQSFLEHADRVQQASEGQRRNYRQKWSLLQPEFEGVALTDIDTKWLEGLRAKRKASTEIVDSEGRRRARSKPLSNATLKKDFEFIRMVMRHAKERDKVLDTLPEFPSFKGRMWKVKPVMRPFLPLPMWKKVRDTAKQRAFERGLNPRTQRQRQELYCFIMLCVGAALRVEEALSLRWRDCELGKFDDGTEYVHLWVYGKHADTMDQREEGWALYDGVVGFKLLKKLRPDAKPDDRLFLEKHTDGIKLLLEACGAREDLVRKMTRDGKSLRSTGISMRLDLGPDPSYNDIADWARTSPVQIANFYDQTHPEASVKRIAGFRESRSAPRNLARTRPESSALTSSYRNCVLKSFGKKWRTRETRGRWTRTSEGLGPRSRL